MSGRWHDRAFGDYEEQYGTIDCRGAVVLDVGADFGSTARFFLHQGAARVYASERLPEWVIRLRAYTLEEPRVSLLPPLRPEDVDPWLLTLRPDVVKVDCEGCEAFFLDRGSDQALMIPRAWVLEVHSLDLEERFTARFTQLGYRIRVVVEHAYRSPEKHRVVLAAERVP